MPLNYWQTIHTEQSIERIAEHRMDALDRSLMRGTLTQAEYDAKCRALNDWAEQEYRRIA